MKIILNINHRARPVMLFFVLLLSTFAQAGTLDEVKSLYNPKGLTGESADQAPVVTATPPRTGAAPVWYRLSNGRQVNLAEWKVVLFMQGHCPYCHQFDPVLKTLSTQHGFSVFPYTEARPAPPEVMKTFFPNIPVATPTTFLVNVNTLDAFPILQGATDAQGFMARLDTLFQMMETPKNGQG